jgi:hypothetical protein
MVKTGVRAFADSGPLTVVALLLEENAVTYSDAASQLQTHWCARDLKWIDGMREDHVNDFSVFRRDDSKL